jgi:hypothetical protein
VEETSMTDPQDTSTDGPDPATDDMKARYREALERKQNKQRSERLHPEGDSPLHEPHGRSGGKREFRRKSGG